MKSSSQYGTIEAMKTIPRKQRKVNTHTNSRYLRELRENISLSETMMGVLLGALMGDGCIIPTASGKNYRLQLEQSHKQKEYLFWKYEIFKEFVITPPKYIAPSNSWRFRTISHKEFIRLRNLFYRNGKKILPKTLDFLLDPLVLAVWFMDDGCLAKKKGYVLNTQNFTFEENIRLKKFLSERFGLSSLSLHRDRKYYRLFVRSRSMAEFRNLFDSHIHSSMNYKLS